MVRRPRNTDRYHCRVPGSFYVPLGDDVWRATAHTAGPWDAGSQHGGPPSALLGREMLRCQPRPDMMITRFTCEILRPIPVGDISVRARLARPGRSVEFLEATASADGREVARASAWRVLRTDGPPVPSRQPAAPPLPGEPTVPPSAVSPPAGWRDGYMSAIEWRPARGSFAVPGPAAVWTRMRYPLVPDEDPAPLERVLVTADSGNGASSELDISRWLFINPELTVHLHREAVGEWICLDAQTTVSPGGAGLATSVLSDLDGQVGVAAQSLLIAPRALPLTLRRLPPGPAPPAAPGMPGLDHEVVGGSPHVREGHLGDVDPEKSGSLVRVVRGRRYLGRRARQLGVTAPGRHVLGRFDRGAVDRDPRVAPDVGELPGAVHHPERDLAISERQLDRADPRRPVRAEGRDSLVRAGVEPAAHPARELRGVLFDLFPACQRRAPLRSAETVVADPIGAGRFRGNVAVRVRYSRRTPAPARPSPTERAQLRNRASYSELNCVIERVLQGGEPVGLEGDAPDTRLIRARPARRPPGIVRTTR
jgi:hypothetical protein